MVIEAQAAPVVLSSEAAPTVVLLQPSAAPAVPTSAVGGVSGLKALELRSGMEGTANSAYLQRLRGSGSGSAASAGAGYYTYASPPPQGDDALALPPPPMVYVKETITTITTTYPAGAFCFAISAVLRFVRLRARLVARALTRWRAQGRRCRWRRRRWRRGA